MNFSFEKQGYVGVLKFYGELTLKRLNELTEALTLSLNNTDYLVVNLKNVPISDCASLIPILSSYHNAETQNKSMKLIGVDKETVQCAANHYQDSGSGPAMTLPY